MPGELLGYEEAVLLFKLIERDYQAKAMEGVVEAQKAPGGPAAHNWKTVWRPMEIARKLLTRELSGRPVVLDAHETLKLKKGGYQISVNQIDTVTAWYLRWRHEQRVDLELKRRRLDRILQQAWIPEFPLIPWDLLDLGDGFHGRDLRGRFLRWVQGVPSEPEKSTKPTGPPKSELVIRICWMNEADFRWFREELLEELDDQKAGGLLDTFDALHADTVAYLNRAATEAFNQAAGSAHYRLSTALDERFALALLKKRKPSQQKMADLLDEPIRLQDRLVKFQDSVRMATEVIGLRHATSE